ncbi:hypothetical protein HDU91_001397, partial [Kappamyces sp. JEL0680]
MGKYTNIYTDSFSGFIFPQQYYTIISALFKYIAMTCVTSLIWIVAKRTRNVMVVATLRNDMAFAFTNFFGLLQKGRLVAIVIFFAVIADGLTATLLDVILNATVQSYQTLGSTSSVMSQFVLSMGPLPFMNQSGLVTSLKPTIQNTPTLGALAVLFNLSPLLSGNAYCTNYNCTSFAMDSSCDDLANVLLNAPAAIQDWGLYENDLASNNDQSLLGTLSTATNISVIAMGPQIAPVVGATPLNQLAMALIKADNDMLWLPIVGSASANCSYIFSQGIRGDSTVTDPAAWMASDSLSLRLIDVVNISFNPTTFQNGYPYACFMFVHADSPSVKCIVTTNFYETADGFLGESYDVLVLSRLPKATQAALESLAPYASLIPLPSTLFINITDGVVAASFPNVLTADLDYSSKQVLDMTHYYSYTVNTSSSVLTQWRQNATTTNPTTFVAGLKPLVSNCSADNILGLYEESGMVPAGTVAVIISPGFIAIFCVCLFFFPGLFWYADYPYFQLKLIAAHLNDESWDVMKPEVFTNPSWLAAVKTKTGIKTKICDSNSPYAAVSTMVTGYDHSAKLAAQPDAKSGTTNEVVK